MLASFESEQENGGKWELGEDKMVVGGKLEHSVAGPAPGTDKRRSNNSLQ